MSRENVERARAGYAAMNHGYRTGDFLPLRRHMEATLAPDCVLEAGGAGVFTEGEWSGIEGLLTVLAGQMEVLDDLWVKPEEFIEAGDDRLVVPILWGGTARHTRLPFEYSAVHVYTGRGGKTVRIQVFATKTKALKAMGLEK